MRYRVLKSSVCVLAMTAMIGCETAKEGISSASRAIDNAFAGDAAYLDESDVCFAQRSALQDESRSFAGEALKEALGAGLVTGLGTLLITGDAGAALRNAAIAGGVAFAVGYLTRKQTGGRSPFEVVTSFNRDVEEDNRRIDRIMSAFDNLNACRRQEAQQIQTAYDSGAITRDEADARMTAVRQRHDQDVAKAREITEGIAKKSGSLRRGV